MEINPQFSVESEAIIEQCTYGICVADSQGVMTRVNSAFERITGLGSHHFLSLHVQEAVDKKIIDNSSILLLLKRKRPSTATVTTMAGRKLFSSAFPVYDRERNVIRMATIMRSVKGAQSLHELEKFFGNNEAFRPARARIVGASPPMTDLFNKIERLSLFDCPVLLTGETGVGKGLFARIIHERSPACKGPFVTVNCSAIPAHLMESEFFGYETGAFTGARKGGKEGLFESADGGTLLLDEIAELPLELQAKLLRVIEARSVMKVGSVRERRLNTRIIASTNKDLEKMVACGDFRQDLFYRLNVFPLKIPPLRERTGDIPELLCHYLDRFNLHYGTDTWIERDAVDALTGYDWPGNVRELANLVERLIILQNSGRIGVDDLPSRFRGPWSCRAAGAGEHLGIPRPYPLKPLKKELEGYEKSILADTLKLHPRQEDAARILGVSMSTLTRKLRKHGLTRVCSTGGGGYA
jgi:PAS domain S-box-containing protein